MATRPRSPPTHPQSAQYFKVEEDDAPAEVEDAERAPTAVPRQSKSSARAAVEPEAPPAVVLVEEGEESDDDDVDIGLSKAQPSQERQPIMKKVAKGGQGQ